MLPVRCVAVSETLSDVATVHEPTPGAAQATLAAPLAAPLAHADEDRRAEESEYERDAGYKCKALVRVHTVNAKFVGESHA